MDKGSQWQDEEWGQVHNVYALEELSSYWALHLVV